MRKAFRKKDFFIAYHHKDEKAAVWIAFNLKELGFTVIMQEWGFDPESGFVEVTAKCSNSCNHTIVILSENCITSDSYRAELYTAFKLNSSLIPIKVNFCDVQKLIGKTKYLDLTNLDEKTALNKLQDFFSHRKSEPSAKPEFEGFGSREQIQPVEKNLKFNDSNEILKYRAEEAETRLKEIISNNYHMTLDLEVEVKKEVEIKDEKTGETRKELQTVWEKIDIEDILNDNKNYLIANLSGMGKTTFLQFLAKELLQNQQKYKFLPLNTTCIEINGRQGTFNEFVDEQIENYYSNSQTHLIDENRNNLCILIDALDQARNTEEIVASLTPQNIERHYKKSKIILSSRQNTAGSVDKSFVKVRLALNNIEEVKNYLGAENFAKVEKFMDMSGEILYTPVLLEMLKIIAMRGDLSENIKNKSSLYNEFTKDFIDEERRKPRFWHNEPEVNDFLSCELEKYLERIAFCSLANSEILEVKIDSLEQFGLSETKKQALLNIGILLEFFEDDKQKLIFRHQSFQAYFAAGYLYHQDTDNSYLQQITGDIRYFYSDEWFEVLQFYFGLITKEDKLIQAVELINAKQSKETDIHKFLRTIYSIFLASQSFVESESIEMLYIEMLYFECFEQIKTNKLVYAILLSSNLDKFNKYNDTQQRLVIELLKPVFEAESINLRIVGTEALGKIVVSKDIELLMPLLSDPSDKVRSFATEALGKIGTVKDIELIKSLLLDTTSNVRIAALDAIVKIILRYDRGLLKAMLSDPSEDVIRIGAYVLWKIWTSKDIELLIPFLTDQKDEWRAYGAFILGEKGTLKNIEHLMPLLSDPSDYVRSCAAEALGKIVTSKEDIDFLLPLIDHENHYIREAGEKALKEIDSYKYDDNSFPGIKSPKEYAIQKIVVSKNIELLKPLLHDEDNYIRKAATEALRKIGTLKDIELLMPLLSDPSDDVRSTGVEAFESLLTPDKKDLKFDVSGVATGPIIAKRLKIAPSKVINILHFSDLHYTEAHTADIAIIYKCFLEDVEHWRKMNNDIAFDAVLITGDLANAGDPNQYTNIESKLIAISKTSGCELENFFFVPGNHDVQNFNDIEAQAESILLQLHADPPQILANELLNEYIRYKIFLDKFNNYKDFLDKIGSTNSKFHEKKETIKPWYSFKLGSLPIRIIGLNSALFTCKKYHEETKIQLGSKQYREAAGDIADQLIEAIANDVNVDEQWIVMAHHPLDWLTEKDKTELHHLMLAHKVIFLHGHTHKEESISTIQDKRKYITIGAGSLYGEEGLNYHNHYQIMTITDKKVKITGKKWEPIDSVNETGGSWQLITDTEEFSLPVLEND